jgi:hypothetical protein
MIERMYVELAHSTAVEGEFEPTFLWERAVNSWMRAEANAPQQAEDVDAAVLNELRLDPRRYRLLKDRALARMQLLRQAEQSSLTVSRSERAAAHKSHRLARDLRRAADLEDWLKEQGLDRTEYDRLIDETAAVESVAASEGVELHQIMIALLKLDGEFGVAATRATAKAAALASGEIRAQAPPRLPPVLLEWFFGTRLRQGVPENIDNFIAGLGLASREAFYGLLAEEYLYSRAGGTDRLS